MSSPPRSIVLAPLLLLACGGSSAAGARLDSGVSGRVLIGPTCPVVHAGKSCERGYRATIAVYTATGHHLVRTFRSGSTGRFRARVAPGRYVLEGTTTGLPRSQAPIAVTVKRHRFAKLTFRFDTGIR